MYKLNNKGFMLAEVIVVSVVLLTVIVTLYAGFNSVYHKYKVRSSYSSIDGSYASSGYLNMFIDELIMARILSSTSLENNGYVDLSDCNNSAYYSDNSKKNICSSIKSTYKITDLYFMKNNLATLKNNNSFDINLRDYLSYLDYVSTSEESSTYNYLIIVKTTDGNYNCLKIR